MRLTALSLTRSSDNTLLYSSQRGYDAVGNVTSVLTTLPDGTDSQAFCYDEQNRLTWASSASATGPCGAANTAGTLTSASYSQTMSYDTLDRLTSSSPLGSYTYGDSAHVHAATAIGSSYTASYDAAGNMTCRAPSSATTCSGTQTGAQLSYDTEGRLTSWSQGTTVDSYLYDGAGNRVEQSVLVNGTATTATTYVAGGQEEIANSSGTTTLTKYFPSVEGLPKAERVGTNGTLSYLGSDGQGSVSAALNASGAAIFQQLYTPYGSVRYSSGSSPTSYGYTGQQADAATGLDYYHARYYDPVAQQFISADSMQDGLNRYGYVHGNPETYADPSGHGICPPGGCGGGGISPCQYNPVCKPKPQPTPPPTCQSDPNLSGCNPPAAPPTIKTPHAPHVPVGATRGGCDTDCVRQKLIAIIEASLLKATYEKDASDALQNLLWDSGAFILDLGLVLFGDESAIVALVTDVAAIGADWGKYQLAEDKLEGKAGTDVLAQLVNAAEEASAILNAVSFLSFGLTALQNVGKKFAEDAGKAIAAFVPALGSGKEALDAYQSQFGDVQEADVGAILNNQTLPELEQDCQSLQISDCQSA